MEEFDYIPPMKASLSSNEFLQQVNNDSRWAAGEKFDGYREVLYTGIVRNDMLSSLGNSHIAKCPQFQTIVAGLAGTVIDCEGLSPTRYLEDNAACFKADPVNAIEWQRKHGNARLVAFDLLRLQGQDMVDRPLSTRVRELTYVVQLLKAVGMPIDQEVLVYEDKKAYYDRIVARTQPEGHEGVILKDMTAPYFPGYRGAAWLKVKREETLICKIVGYMLGTGKFTGMIGSIKFETVKGGVGWASGMSDAERIDMTNHWDNWLGKYVYITCQEVTRLGSLRHPRYTGLANKLQIAVDTITNVPLTIIEAQRVADEMCAEGLVVDESKLPAASSNREEVTEKHANN